MNIPASGPNPAKQKFFNEVASAFEFLAIFNSLPEAAQQEILELITKLQAKHLK